MGVSEKNICRTHFVHLHISELMPGPSSKQSQTTPFHSHAKSCQPTQASRARQHRSTLMQRAASPFTLFFILHPTGSSAKERKQQATTEPDSKSTSSLSSNRSSTVNFSSSEGEDEKDFILPDYPSDELTSSKLSNSEAEDAFAESLSTGWSEKVTHVYTSFCETM